MHKGFLGFSIKYVMKENLQRKGKGKQLKAQHQEHYEHTIRELEHRNFELDALIYRLSHDLRSPITTILGLFNLTRIENNPEKISTYMEMAENQAFKMDKFIQSIIHFAQANRHAIEPEVINFEDLIITSLKSFHFMPEFEDIEKHIQIHQEVSGFKTDILRLQMILNNLISNAIQFQNPYKEQKALKIQASIKEFEARISIEDNGTGIAENCQEKVFDMFYRGSELSKGSGLGLYIVKRSVLRLGGQVILASKEGEFTKITISIPNLLHPKNPQKYQEADAVEKHLSNESIGGFY